ncbi:MAG: 3-phosphoglycerate dehydrogenase family protein [Clostridiales bacterium]|nr:3-phosphoglycerate dehydrogenase family protein [Clostridiales bacterium]
MFRIKTLNEISPVINKVFTADYAVGSEIDNEDAIIVRSAKMHDMPISDSLLAVARAGAGYNNIPVDKCSERGIVVFNTPGANANAVKELTIAGMLLAGRDIVGGIEWARTLKGEGDKVAALVEKGKNHFVGPELKGKKLAVIGLGAIGTMVANAGHALEMDVYGYDPFLSIEHALMLSRAVHKVGDLDKLLAEADFVSLHLPLTDKTHGMVDADMLSKFKPGAALLNFSRGELVDSAAVLEAVKAGRLRRYVTDFPSEDMLGAEGVIALPHLGASTPESEDNCAEMAAQELSGYLTRGAIINSVNYPACDPGYTDGARLCVLHANVPNMVGSVTALLAAQGINIANMVNKSRGALAYTVIDADGEIGANVVKAVAAVENVYKVRLI